LKNKVLITGATGFIGSHLAELCVKKGYDVIAFDRYNPNNSWGWLENSKYKNEMEIVLGDIRDFDSVYNVMKKCNSVFHLAALIGIPYSYISPMAYIRTNVEGTYNVLESAKKLNYSQILITSTSETYGSAQYSPIDEKHPYVGQSPYSATKISADALSISYYRSFDLPVKIVRPFNTYGPRQSQRAIIPTIIAQLLSNNTKLKLGNLEPTRDLTFVKDTTSGFIKIFKSSSLFGEATNIGMNKEISIYDLVNKIAQLINVEIEISEDNNRKRPPKSEVDRLICDNNKIINNTDWEPIYDLNSGLIETIEWTKNNQESSKSKTYIV